MDKYISFIIPYNEINEERKKNFEFVYDRLRNFYPESEIIISEYKETPFSRGRAINYGAKKSSRPVLALVDADIIFEKELINESLFLLEQNTWVIPFNEYCSIVKNDTLKILNSSCDVSISELGVLLGHIYKHTVGAMGIIRRKDFLEMGGFDEKLVDWGYDDNIFQHKADILIGEHKRLNKRIYHLFHESDRSWENENTKTNKSIWEEVVKINTKEDMKKYYNL